MSRYRRLRYMRRNYAYALTTFSSTTPAQSASSCHRDLIPSGGAYATAPAG